MHLMSQHELRTKAEILGNMICRLHDLIQDTEMYLMSSLEFYFCLSKHCGKDGLCHVVNMVWDRIMNHGID